MVPFSDHLPHEIETDDFGISLEDILPKDRDKSDARVKASPVTTATNAMMQDTSIIRDRWRFSKALSEQQIEGMLKVLNNYPIWDGIGCLNTGEVLKMPLKNQYKDASAVQKPYDMSPEKRKHYDKIMAELERQGIVEDSHASRYCSPALIVVRNGRPRLVIDFRKINSMCQQDYYPLPRQTDIFAKLNSARYITLFDLKKAFYQLPIDMDFRDLTTFITKHGGAKRLTRSMMGYLNSPSHCQRIIDRLIAPYRWESIMVYMDDIVIFSRSWEEHLVHVEWLLSQLQKVGLTLDPDKAYIGYQSINLLGHTVGRFGLATQHDKVKAMSNMRKPNTVRELMKILGFFGYYRNFIRSFAQIATPLTDLIRKGNKRTAKDEHLDSKLDWNESHNKAFQELKDRLSNSTVLAHPHEDDCQGYRLYVDGCKIGVGAALHVVVPDPENKSIMLERPICFISRALKPGEKRYWPTELEMLGLTWSLRRFEEIIEGKPLTVYTDHSALVWLFKATNSKTGGNQRLLLWSLQLEKWKSTTTVVHRPGRAHLNADVLSRFPVDSDTPEEFKRSLVEPSDFPPSKETVSLVSVLLLSKELTDKLQHGYANDPHWATLYNKLSSEANSSRGSIEYHNFRYDFSSGLLYYIDPADKNVKLCVPKDCIQQVLSGVHDNSGHLGFHKVYDKIKESYHIHKLSGLLREYLSSCPTCATLRNKDHRNDLLHPIEIPRLPCEVITIDFVTGLPQDNGYDSFISITDKFSKYVTLIANKTTDRAPDVASRFFTEYYPRFGLPSKIISDRDPKFISRFWQCLFSKLKVELLLSTAYAPQTDGQSERTNQTVEQMLRSYIGYDPNRQWTSDLKEIEFILNSHSSESSSKSPFEILYGFNPRSAWNFNYRESDPETNLDFFEQREIIRSEALRHLDWSRAIMAKKYDQNWHERDLAVGDEVYIENRSGLSIPGLITTKTGPKRFGPFRIIKLVGTGAVKLDLPSTYKMHDVISRRHVTLAKPDAWNRIPDRPPAVVTDDGEEEYEVERVLDERKFKKRTQYLIKWVGYPVHEATWIDADQAPSFSEALAKFKANRRKSRTTSN